MGIAADFGCASILGAATPCTTMTEQLSNRQHIRPAKSALSSTIVDKKDLVDMVEMVDVADGRRLVILRRHYDIPSC